MRCAPRLALTLALLVVPVAPLFARADEAATRPAPAAKAGDAAAAIDAMMEKRIHDRLLEVFGADAEPVHVAFYDGKAVLTGKVKTRVVQRLAREVVVALDGVGKVENRLESDAISSYAGERAKADAADLALEISVKSRLGAQIGVNASDLEVEAADGVVTLRGVLKDEARKKIAVEVISSTKGVVRWIDLIRVLP